MCWTAFWPSAPCCDMAVAIICVGRLREKFYQEAAAEYQKRLSRLTKLEVIELPDRSEPQNASPALQKQVTEREGEMILSRLKPSDHVAALCIDAEQMDSPSLAAFIRRQEGLGKRTVFVIGGSLGLSDAVQRRADIRISMSKMTFPHQLARVMLLEQLYRAHKINAGERYHK